jgi:predicted nucleic acid-binding protein
MSVMSKSLVCVDASLILKLVLPEEYSERALMLWKNWLRDGIQPVSPRLLVYEVTSVLRKHAHRGVLPQSSAEEAFAAINRIITEQIEITDPSDMHEKAWELAGRFNRPTAYDCHYLALAEHMQCPFWTADERLFNVVRDKLEWVSWIGHSSC